jgi:hypothetical protein
MRRETTPRQREWTMADIVWVGLSVLFFALALGYVWACERL